MQIHEKKGRSGWYLDVYERAYIGMMDRKCLTFQSCEKVGETTGTIANEK